MDVELIRVCDTHRSGTRQIKHGRGIGRCGCGIHSHGISTYWIPWKAVP